MFRTWDSGLCHRVALTVQSNFWRDILASVFTNQSTHRSVNPKSYHTNNMFKSLGFSGWRSVQRIVLWAFGPGTVRYRRYLPFFGRTFLRLSYVDVIKHTYSRRLTVTEIMAREKCVFFFGSTSCMCLIRTLPVRP